MCIRDSHVTHPEAQPHVVEDIAAWAILACQHTGEQEHEQEREADARREEPRQYADEDQYGGSQQRYVQKVHGRSIGAAIRPGYGKVTAAGAAVHLPQQLIRPPVAGQILPASMASCALPIT